MITNVYTKFSSGFDSIDLCANVNVCLPVREMYYKYKGRCEAFLQSVYYADNTKNNRYVYAWFAKTEPKRYFYVGKGTDRRYNHILYKIKEYKNGKKNERFKRFSEIQEKWGIDYEIVIKGLTDYEALIYEQCLKLQFIDNGEVLLNVEGIPYESLCGDWDTEKNNSNEPKIIKEKYYERYFDDYNTPFFDNITTEDLMSTYIYPYFINQYDSTVISEKKFIINWLSANKGRIYKCISTKTKSVIIQGVLMYDRYLDYRKKGLLIYSSRDVINYIKTPH